MKNGILFFFHMGRIATVARLAVIPCGMLILQAVPGSIGFWTYVTITVIALLLALVHTPSDRAMLGTLEHFRQEAHVEMKRLCQIRDDEHYTVLEGYRKTGNMRLRRQVGTEMIYPSPITLVYAEKERKRCLVIAQKSLFTSDPPTYELFSLTSASELKMLRIEAPADQKEEKVVELTLYTKAYPNGITLFAKNDYHYREFVAGIQKEI